MCSPAPKKGAMISGAPGDPVQHGVGIGRRSVSRPHDVLVRTHEDEASFVVSTLASGIVANDLERNVQAPGRLLEGAHVRIAGAERDERKAAAELVEYVAARGQRARRQMVARPRL